MTDPTSTLDDGLTRRSLLAATAGIGLAALEGARSPLSARPASRTPARDGRCGAVRRVGPFEVLALLDASGPFFRTRQETFPQATDADWDAARSVDPGAFRGEDTWWLDFRCFLVRGPHGRLTLVDTGIGPASSPAAAWAPVPGRLPERLAAAGVDPADVDTVVLTHLHEDHVGWSVDEDRQPLFPDARYVVQQRELDLLAPDDALVPYVVAPLRAAGLLHPVDGRTRLSGARARGTGLTAVPTPGHTPGHQSLLVAAGDVQLLITGDLLVHAVQLVDPDVGYRYEADQELARQTRRTVLAEARRTRTVLATSHLVRPFVALGG